MKPIFSFVQTLFFIFMALFLLGGLAIVATQGLGVLVGNGGIVLSVKAWLAPATFTCATLCAICAFILNYRPEAKAGAARN